MKLNIAYVDDEETVRLGVVALMERLGDLAFGIVESNGVQFLNAIRKTNKRPDICMVDISMPGMDGFMLVDAIKQEWPELPILILTSYDVEHFIIKMIRKGVNGYVLKDSRPQVIKDALITIHEEGHYYSDKVNHNLFSRVKSREFKAKDFTQRDIEFLQYCCSELSYSEMAKKLGVTTRSIEGIRDKLFHKYGINSRVSLVFLAMKNNFVPMDIIFQD